MFQPNALAICQDCGKNETRATIHVLWGRKDGQFWMELRCDDCARKEAAARGWTPDPDCFF
jgi:hypothetical protein